MFESHYAGASGAGIPVGTYWYSYATDVDGAKKEAAACLETIRGKTFEFPVAFDIEDPSQRDLGRDRITDIAVAFWKRLNGPAIMPHSTPAWTGCATGSTMSASSDSICGWPSGAVPDSPTKIPLDCGSTPPAGAWRGSTAVLTVTSPIRITQQSSERLASTDWRLYTRTAGIPGTHTSDPKLYRGRRRQMGTTAPAGTWLFVGQLRD